MLFVVALRGMRAPFTAFLLTLVLAVSAAAAFVPNPVGYLAGAGERSWTPVSGTGSTAYAFSAGGPIVWPDVEALLLVPISAHALFARPMVTSPHSRVAVEVESSHPAIAICDGRRSFPLPPGARIEAVRSERSVKWLRIDAEPFADRLVTKFSLPVTGWRGRGR